MSRGRPKFSDAQREAVYRLKCEGKSGAAIAELCAAGFGDVPAFTISPQYANELAGKLKRERETLTLTGLARKPTGDALRTLTARMISIGEREIESLARDQRAGRMDPRAFASVARSLRELQALAAKIPNAPATPDASSTPSEDPAAETEPRTFLGSLLEDDGANPPAGDVRVRPDGRPFAPARAAKTEPEPEAPITSAPSATPPAAIAERIETAARAARAAQTGTLGERSEPASSGARALDRAGVSHKDASTPSNKARGQAINGANTEPMPDAVARVLARRTASS